MPSNGRLFVVSAPSGAGKTTLVRYALERFSSLAYSVSHTTRPPRTGEIHGKDYFFTDTESFVAMIDDGQMLEWAKVHDNYYGTSRTFVEKTLGAGKDLLLDIDVQGAGQIMEKKRPLVSIFIQPPSLDVLRQRLETRGTDSQQVIEKRLDNAAGEMAHKDRYDHVVVNDDLERAKEAFCALFEQKGSGN